MGMVLQTPLVWVGLPLAGAGLVLPLLLLAWRIDRASKPVPSCGNWEVDQQFTMPFWFSDPFRAWMEHMGKQHFGHSLERVPAGLLRWVAVGSTVLAAWAIALIINTQPQYLLSAMGTALLMLLVGVGSALSLVMLLPLSLWAERQPFAKGPNPVWPMLMVWIGAVVVLSGLLWGLGTRLAPQQELLAWVTLVYVAFWNGGTVWFLNQSTKWRLKPNRFCCDRCQTQVLELNQAGIEPLLTAVEQRELQWRDRCSSYATRWRGWYCPSCHPSLSREACYLVRFRQTSAVCPGCGAVAFILAEGRDQRQCQHCGYQSPRDQVDMEAARQRLQDDPQLLEEINRIQAVSKWMRRRAGERSSTQVKAKDLDFIDPAELVDDWFDSASE